MPIRGLQRKEIKSLRTERKNVYARSEVQKKARNAADRERRYKAKILSLTQENAQLIESNHMLTQSMLSCKENQQRVKNIVQENLCAYFCLCLRHSECVVVCYHSLYRCDRLFTVKLLSCKMKRKKKSKTLVLLKQT